MAVELLTDADDPVVPPSGPSRGHVATRYVLDRGARLLVLLVGVAVLGFVLVEASPIDPVDGYLGGDSVRVSAEQRAAIADRWGLDEPAAERFGRYLANLARGDLGTSTIFNLPVGTVIGERFVASFALLGLSWVLSGILGFTLGILAAARRGRWLDRAIRVGAYTLASAPTFWVGLLLLTVFSVSLGWFPTSGATPVGLDPASATLGQRVHHLLLPAATLSIVGIAPIALHTRQQAVEVLDSDVALFARAQGETTWGLIRHRVVRNAAVPALLLQFASFSELLGGAVLAEQVFNYPGLGEATVRAGVQGDVPLLLGISLFAAVLVFVGNQLGDLAQRAADPRVSVLGGRS